MKLLTLVGISLILTGLVIAGMMGAMEKDRVIISEKNAFKGEMHVIYVKAGEFYVKGGRIIGENSTNGHYYLNTGKYTVVVEQNGTFLVKRCGISSDWIFSLYPAGLGVLLLILAFYSRHGKHSKSGK